jgi:two-component system response regulator VicR
MRILFVEPDKILASVYSDALTKAGHKVATAYTAQAAINKIDAESPDLIILEVQLAAHNGIEFLYELRSYGEWQHIPVLIHTMVPDHQLQPGVDTQHLGISGYLYKPATSILRLISTVKNVQPVVV